jgi:hypothetical protein
MVGRRFFLRGCRGIARSTERDHEALLDGMVKWCIGLAFRKN